MWAWTCGEHSKTPDTPRFSSREGPKRRGGRSTGPEPWRRNEWAPVRTGKRERILGWFWQWRRGEKSGSDIRQQLKISSQIGAPSLLLLEVLNGVLKQQCIPNMTLSDQRRGSETSHMIFTTPSPILRMYIGQGSLEMREELGRELLLCCPLAPLHGELWEICPSPQT